MKKMSVFILILIVVLIILGGAYWYFLMRPITSTPVDTTSDENDGYSPLPRPQQGTQDDIVIPSNTSTSSGEVVISKKIPTLRLLSNTPVGGFGASTTASTSVVRWIDRGRGNIYEANSNSLEIITLSNTVLPKIYESVWNKNLTAFVGTMFGDGISETGSVFAELNKRPTITASTTNSTSTIDVTSSLSPYELKGKNLPENIITYALSPKKDRLFMLNLEGNNAAGYISTLDGRSVNKIFETPITQAVVEWPEENTITLTTKPTASQSGYLYFINPKNGIWKKILGPFPGLSTKTSRDAKYVLVSISNNNSVLTSIYSVSKGSGVDAIVRTLADKCVWGNFYNNLVYCAVPSQNVSGTYPDEWYVGRLSLIDKIWQINASTGEVKLISSVVNQSDRVIDAFNLGLDEKDNYLYFMNKNDLTLWSLDLVSENN